MSQTKNMAGFFLKNNLVFSLACGQIWLDVLAISSSNLVLNNKPKVLKKLVPSFFQPWTPTLKQALVSAQCTCNQTLFLNQTSKFIPSWNLHLKNLSKLFKCQNKDRSFFQGSFVLIWVGIIRNCTKSPPVIKEILKVHVHGFQEIKERKFSFLKNNLNLWFQILQIFNDFFVFCFLKKQFYKFGTYGINKQYWMLIRFCLIFWFWVMGFSISFKLLPKWPFNHKIPNHKISCLICPRTLAFPIRHHPSKFVHVSSPRFEGLTSPWMWNVF